MAEIVGFACKSILTFLGTKSAAADGGKSRAESGKFAGFAEHLPGRGGIRTRAPKVYFLVNKPRHGLPSYRKRKASDVTTVTISR
jgi:hypothetical protein